MNAIVANRIHVSIVVSCTDNTIHKHDSEAEPVASEAASLRCYALKARRELMALSQRSKGGSIFCVNQLQETASRCRP
jgi:hypothetical protein